MKKVGQSLQRGEDIFDRRWKRASAVFGVRVGQRITRWVLASCSKAESITLLPDQSSAGRHSSLLFHIPPYIFTYTDSVGCLHNCDNAN